MHQSTKGEIEEKVIVFNKDKDYDPRRARRYTKGRMKMIDLINIKNLRETPCTSWIKEINVFGG